MYPYTPVEGAITVAEMIMAEIYTLHLPHARSLTCDRVSLSLGISWIVPQPDIPWKMAIAIADKALYQAKQEGRNRYCVYVQTGVQISTDRLGDDDTPPSPLTNELP